MALNRHSGVTYAELDMIATPGMAWVNYLSMGGTIINEL